MYIILLHKSLKKLKYETNLFVNGLSCLKTQNNWWRTDKLLKHLMKNDENKKLSQVKINNTTWNYKGFNKLCNEMKSWGLIKTNLHGDRSSELKNECLKGDE